MMLGLDVGGTHTDVVVNNGKEVARKAKILTKQDDLLESVLFGGGGCQFARRHRLPHSGRQGTEKALPRLRGNRLALV